MAEYSLRAPVALIVFNRPDTAERVFAEIRKARPSKLLVISDGARAHKPGEAELVARSRSVIERVDWPCEVLTNFADNNLGCKRRVSSGIDWIFSQVEEAIILEDDCLPHPSFFRFCDELLERYRDDLRVGMISGDNFQNGARRNGDSYYFSRYAHIWGWATWRSRWAKYDVNMGTWPEVRAGKWLEDVFEDRKEARYWSRIFDRVHAGKVDTWDYQWVLNMFTQRWFSIVPNGNLISNVGFGPGATHTLFESKLANMRTVPMAFPLSHPNFVVHNRHYDVLEFKSAIDLPLHEQVIGGLRFLRAKARQLRG